MLQTLCLLQSLDVFVHPVLPRQFITAGEVIHPLMRQQRLVDVRVGVRAGPHDVEVRVVGTNLLESLVDILTVLWELLKFF